MTEVPQKAWVCSVCGYIHYGPEPPAECPVCGADASNFELQAEQAPIAVPAATAADGLTVIIVGAGIAGISAAEALRKASHNVKILLLSNEKDPPYYRLNLTRYLADDLSPELFDLHPKSWYTSNRIDLHFNVEITSIIPELKTIAQENGEVLNFDRLILATGARPFVPPVPGTQLGNVHTLRTRRDADIILENCRGKKVVCIGGGLLGLEAAGALNRREAEVTVLEGLDWLIPRQLNQKAAGIFKNFVERSGISVQTGIKVKELSGNDVVNSVLLEDNAEIPADLVIFSAGVRANTDLAIRAGLKVNQGIVVDQSMRTSQPDIFAAGDAVEYEGILYGAWSPAMAQGIVAGTSAAGQNATFNPLPRSAVLKVLGIDLFSSGKINLEDGDILIEETGPDKYLGFIFQDGIISGAILLGDTSAAAETKKAIDNHLDCAALLKKQPKTEQVLDFLK